jgi:hypothetical protein
MSDEWTLVVSKKSLNEMKKQVQVEKSLAQISGQQFNMADTKKKIISDHKKNKGYKAKSGGKIQLICHSFEINQDMYDIYPPGRNLGEKYTFSDIGCWEDFPIDFVRVKGTYRDEIQAVGTCHRGHVHVLSEDYIRDKIRDPSTIDPKYFRNESTFPREMREKIFPNTFSLAMQMFH